MQGLKILLSLFISTFIFVLLPKVVNASGTVTFNLVILPPEKPTNKYDQMVFDQQKHKNEELQENHKQKIDDRYMNKNEAIKQSSLQLEQKQQTSFDRFEYLENHNTKYTGSSP